MAENNNSTNSSHSIPFTMDRFDTTRIILLSLQILIFFVGMIGNILVCIITSKKRNMKVVGNRFILNLAIADIGILSVDYPVAVAHKEFSLSWPFGEFACKVIFPFTDIFYGVGIGCITAIALHRYKMLVHCTKPQMNMQTVKRVLFLIWLLSFIISVMPQLFIMELKHIPKIGIWICEPRWQNGLSFKLYEVTSILAFYFFPLAIISSTYIRIRAKLHDNIRKNDSFRRASFRSQGSTRKGVVSRIGQNRRALKLLAPVVIAFAVCMAPYIFTQLVEIFLKNPGKTFAGFKHMPTLLRVFRLLLNTNSSVNPIIYSVVNTEFRREFARLLRCDSDTCCADSTEGLDLNTLRRSSTVNKSRDIKRSSSSNSRRGTSSKSSSRNSADKMPAKEEEQV